MANLYDLDDAERANVLDSRDLIALRESLTTDLEIAEEDPEGSTVEERQDLRDQIATIDELEDEISDWCYGATLINEDYFEDYARELADDIGAIDSDAGWPTSYIDWSAAADALAIDYSSVEIGSTSFYVR